MVFAYLEATVDEETGKITVKVKKSDGTEEVVDSVAHGYARIREILEEFISDIPRNPEP